MVGGDTRAPTVGVAHRLHPRPVRDELAEVALVEQVRVALHQVQLGVVGVRVAQVEPERHLGIADGDDGGGAEVDVADLQRQLGAAHLGDQLGVEAERPRRLALDADGLRLDAQLRGDDLLREQALAVVVRELRIPAQPRRDAGRSLEKHRLHDPPHSPRPVRTSILSRSRAGRKIATPRPHVAPCESDGRSRRHRRKRMPRPACDVSGAGWATRSAHRATGARTVKPLSDAAGGGKDGTVNGFAAVDFEFARQVLQRGIAALFVVAFVSTLNQFRPLLGEHGLLPAPELLDWARSSKRGRRLLHPTLFRHVRYTDRRLVALCAAGIVVATTLVIGIPQLGPPWVPMLCFLALWLGYMSITSIGQTFYGFGWEMLLLEAGFLAAFLGSDAQPPPTVVIVLFWWLVFRLEFGAGMIKIRGGREWRDLTALMYHHETQPMPGPLSRQAHLLPAVVPPRRGARQPLRAARRAVVPVRAAARAVGARSGARDRRRGRGGDRDRARSCGSSSPATSPGSTGSTVVLAFSAIGVPGHRRSAGPAGIRSAMDHRRDAAVLGRRDRRRRRALRGAQLAAAAQPLRPPPAHERELQPLAARQRVRRVRHGDEGAHRDRRRGHDGRGSRRRRDLARVRVQGQAGRSAPDPPAVRAVPPAARLADVVPAARALARATGSRRSCVRLLEADAPTLRLLAHDPFDGRAPAVGAGGVVPLPVHDARRSSARRARAGCATAGGPSWDRCRCAADHAGRAGG